MIIIYFALLLVFCYFIVIKLAEKGLFFTTLKNNEIKFLIQGDKIVSFISNVSGWTIENNTLVESRITTPGLSSPLLLGIYQISRFPLQRLGFSLQFETTYNNKFPAVEFIGNVKADLELRIILRIIKPLALVEKYGEQWLEKFFWPTVSTALNTVATDLDYIDTYIPLDKTNNGPIAQEMKRLLKAILAEHGLEIVDFSFTGQTITDETLAKSVMAVANARMQGDAEIERAKRRAEALLLLANATYADTAALLRILDSIEGLPAGEKANILGRITGLRELAGDNDGLEGRPTHGHHFDGIFLRDGNGTTPQQQGNNKGSGKGRKGRKGGGN
jgi:regulator of protease activity HflC (stomatin/prohibitin superfamily)